MNPQTLGGGGGGVERRRSGEVEENVALCLGEGRPGRAGRVDEGSGQHRSRLVEKLQSRTDPEGVGDGVQAEDWLC